MNEPSPTPDKLARERAGDVKLIAKGGAIQVVGQFTQKILAFLMVAVGIRVLGTSGYGLYRQVYQILTILTAVAAGGFPSAAVRFIARARVTGDFAGVRGAARICLMGAVTGGLIVVAGVAIWALPLARAFADSEEGVEYLAFLLRIGVAYVPLYAGMQVLRYCTQAYKTMTPGVMVGNVIQPLSRFLFTVAAFAMGFAVTGAVVGLVLSAALAVAAGELYFRRLLTEEERRSRPHAAVKPILRFAFPVAGASLFSTQSLGLGIILVGIYGTDEQVGLYGIAQALQLAGGLFLSSIAGIWAPVVVDIYHRGDLPRLQSLYQTINRWVATFSVPVFVALILQPEFFTRLLGGSAGVEAAVLVPILAAGNLFHVATGPSAQLLSMTGRPGVNLVNSVTSVGLYVGLGVIFVPKYGVIGMAAVDAAVTALLNIARTIEGKLLVGVQPFGRTFIKPVLAISVAAGALVLWEIALGDSTAAAAGGLVMAAICYMGILKALGLDPEEREVIDAVRGRVAGLFRSRT